LLNQSISLFYLYIADIPTTLIEAFRATLNDAIDAHILIHVCDISHPDYVVQRKVVLQTLLELNVSASKLESMITVYNKYDLLDQQTSEKHQTDEDNDGDEDQEEEKEMLPQKSIPEINIENDNGIYISCKTGQGLGELLDIVQKRLMIASDRVTCEYRVLQGGQLYQALVNDGLCSIENMIVDEDDSQFIRLKCLFSRTAYAWCIEISNIG
jgi:50S ribosomal subunit-associated GTPase HflX